MKTLHVICNPAAKRGHTVEVYRKLRAWADQRQDLKLSLHMTATPKDATNITKQLSDTNEDVYILIIGGDGTINEVVNGIVNFEHTYLMILPFGSGNDFVYTLGLKEKDPVELMNDYMNGTHLIRANYLLINNEIRAINSTGLGISAEVIKCRNGMKAFSPKTQYNIASFRKGMFYKNFTFWASFDNKPEIKIESPWFVATNGKRMGSKIYATPDAQLDDDLIDIMYLEKFNRIHTLSVLSNTMNKKIKKIKSAKFLKCKEFSLILKDACIEYDGHLLDHLNYLNVKIGPERVNIVVPNNVEPPKD